MHRVDESSKRFLGLDRFGWSVVAVLLLSIGLYLPAAKGGPIWDDAGFIDGRTIGGGKSLLACFTHPFNLSYYRPLVSASLYLDRAILGNNTFYYHQTNMLLHAATVGVLILFVGTLVRNRRVGLLAGLLFAVQPVQMPVVAWIGGRTDALCVLFVAAYLLGLVRWAQGNRYWLFLVAAAFFGAIMTKEQALLLLPVAPLAAVLLRPKGDRLRPALWATGSVLVVSAAFLGLCLLYTPELGRTAGAIRPRGLTTFGQTCLHYAMLLVAPEQSRLFTYSLASYRPEAMWPGLLIALAVLVGLFALGRRSTDALWVSLVALLALLPVSNLVPVPSLLVAPYRVGVAGLPIAALMALGVWRLRDVAGRWKFAVPALCAAYIAYEAALVAWGSAQYQSSPVFFETATHYDPGCIVTGQCLVRDLIAANKIPEAAHETERMLDFTFRSGRWRDLRSVPSLLARDPSIETRIIDSHGGKVPPKMILGELLCCYGWACERQGDRSQARVAYQSAQAISPRDPHAFADEGSLIGKTDPVAGRTLVLKALDLDPNDSQSLSYMATDAESRRDWPEAARYYLLAVEGQPWMGGLHMGAARALANLGRRQEALEQLDLAKTAIVDRAELDALRKRIEKGRT